MNTVAGLLALVVLLIVVRGVWSLCSTVFRLGRVLCRFLKRSTHFAGNGSGRDLCFPPPSIGPSGSVDKPSFGKSGTGV